jgi:glyoxylase-like metal-dependent hydrolase (beta-lactamase superfamily II)
MATGPNSSDQSIGSATTGDIRIKFVPDGEVRVDPTVAFPGTTHEQWRAHADLLDQADHTGFSVGSFLLRSPDILALVDLGLGPMSARTDAGASYSGGALLDKLDQEGIAPDDVDLVVFTHLHRDHVGWTSRETPSGRQLTFPNARHVAHHAEWDHWTRHSSPVGPDEPTVLTPLAKRIELCDDHDTLAPGIQVLATPGHTPGHLSVRIDSWPDGNQILIAGDCLHSPAQLQHPDWAFGSDHDASQAATSRAALLASPGGQLLACGHFPTPQLVTLPYPLP